MNGPIAQRVALTCHGNAIIRKMKVPQFFPINSTCQFCDYVKIPEPSTKGRVLDVPDEWLSSLSVHKVRGLRLVYQERNNMKISGRASAGFVGGGRVWKIEVMLNDGTSEFLVDKWEVWNQNAPEKRIWRVTYGVVEIEKTAAKKFQPLSEIMIRFHNALKDIHAFSEAQKCANRFAAGFASALKVLDTPELDVGYHKDLFPKDALNRDAVSLLKAAMSAWVFGGMGSWNDMGFLGEMQNEYERVSDALFNSINEAIAIAATSSIPMD